MKTSKRPFRHSHKSSDRIDSAFKAVLSIIFGVLIQVSVSAQQPDGPMTLFGPPADIGFVWATEVKVNTIQDQTGSVMGFYAGALINRSLLLGGALGSNIGHPTVNYSYLGLLAQYTFEPAKLVHPSTQVVIACASTKDYESEKSSTFDNFGNTTGTPFYFVEPGANLEINLGKSVRLVTGLSYRYAFGLQNTSKHVVKTHVTSSDMSGFNVNMGLKFGLY